MEDLKDNEIAYFTTPLPEDVARAKAVGDFPLTRELIQAKLQNEKISQTVKRRLAAEINVLALLEKSQYPYDEATAQAKMAEAFTDYQSEELRQLVVTNDVEWVYHDGQRYFHARFIDNLVKTRQDYFQRYRFEEENNIDNERQTELDGNITVMKAQGKRQAKITLRQSLAPKNKPKDDEGPFLAQLPLPRQTGFVSGGNLLETHGPVSQVDSTEALQRTIAFTTEVAEETAVSVTHEYTLTAEYHDLFPLLKQTDFPKQLSVAEIEEHLEDLTELAPHIVFTPFLLDLLAEITEEEMTLAQKAFAIYSFVTTQVNYSYMREYYAIPNISEYCAVNQKGDCGVQALLFITLCRMAGIPARWESGLYVSEFAQGPHDWAQFYLPTVGWLYADASFGGSAYRGGNEARWQYYFGNLDVFRMPANSKIQVPFTTEKQFLRADPIDNQRGEFESRVKGYTYDELDYQVELLDFRFINE